MCGANPFTQALVVTWRVFRYFLSVPFPRYEKAEFVSFSGRNQLAGRIPQVVCVGLRTCGILFLWGRTRNLNFCSSVFYTLLDKKDH